MQSYRDTSIAGFPIIIQNPEFQTIDGEKVLKIKHNTIFDTIFLALLDTPGAFTGNELKFIRHFLDLTQTEFADDIVLGEGGHARISTWERKKDDCINMEPAVAIANRMEMALRFEKINKKKFKKKLDAMKNAGLLQRNTDWDLSLTEGSSVIPGIRGVTPI